MCLKLLVLNNIVFSVIMHDDFIDDERPGSGSLPIIFLHVVVIFEPPGVSPGYNKKYDDDGNNNIIIYNVTNMFLLVILICWIASCL